MSIKILHAADFHLDSPFDSMPEDKAILRRAEQRELLSKIAQTAETENVDLILLAGDLFDSAISYFETKEAFERFFASIRTKVFIAPGNHDYYSHRSPYAFMNLPENVHVFTSPIISSVTLPELGCRIWGAGFNSQLSNPLLTGFSADTSELVEIMVMHGDMLGGPYNAVTESEIAQSGLDYLALGHVHTFSGIKKAGNTAYAYPGCPEGRGFDETGEKGLIVGTVSKLSTDLRFKSLGSRQYNTIDVCLDGFEEASDAIASQIPENAGRDILKITLCGEYAGGIDTESLVSMFEDNFFHLTIKDNSYPPRNIWEDRGTDTLKGLFLRRLYDKYKLADDDEQAKILLAVKYGLAALENREAWYS